MMTTHDAVRLAPQWALAAVTLILLSVVCACGPVDASDASTEDAGTSDPGTFVGTVTGYGLTPRDAVAFVWSDAFYGQYTTIVLTEAANVCSDWSAGGAQKDRGTLYLTLENAHHREMTGYSTAVPGRYGIATNDGVNQAWATFIEGNAGQCPEIPSKVLIEAMAGVVDVDTNSLSAGGGSIDGHFELNIAGDSVTGTFHAATCTAPVEEDHSGCLIR